MKPSNILIFSLSMGIFINAKISDYGLSQYVTPSGFSGRWGTLAYRAPEVSKDGLLYNKEVSICSLWVGWPISWTVAYDWMKLSMIWTQHLPGMYSWIVIVGKTRYKVTICKFQRYISTTLWVETISYLGNKPKSIWRPHLANRNRIQKIVCWHIFKRKTKNDNCVRASK